MYKEKLRQDIVPLNSRKIYGLSFLYPENCEILRDMIVRDGHSAVDGAERQFFAKKKKCAVRRV